ncbi:cyclin-D3-3-like [Dendrobium catenatum]|uniref:Cyclin-D3-3 n=1 Tax=Dendrobium catenatum TaxID=906689 RepID=A0A2I0WVL9_9ASPA|nr:cyclin-D3-3-like [Dendrobium catenatum]PKU79709.1 Cyclin-D3-3 [Dendrobium catenatum]
MEDSDCSLSISTLICHEDQAFSIDDDEIQKNELPHLPYNSFHLDTDDDYIETLISKEINTESTNIEFLLHCDWLRCEAIQWILRMKECFGFSPQTVYQAVSYFDRFLMRRTIDDEKSWVLQLLALACLSLAAKMEEVTTPALMDYHTEQCYFDSITIQRMELLVLSTLEWRMSSVTPLSYINYFAKKFYGRNLSRELLSKTIGFIFSILKDINLVEFRASVIAAAAVLAAIDQKLTIKALESRMKSVSSSGLVETELVYSCYKLMTWESKKSSILSNSMDSSELFESTIDNFVDVSDCSSLAGNSNKRRRFQKSQID